MKEVVIVTVRKLLIGAAALSVAALVPAALAAERPDDRAERFSPDMAPAAPTRPDDRAERPTSGPTQPVAAEPTTGTGVEWSNRLVVAALAALAAAVAVAMAYGIVHRRGGGTGTTGTPGRPATTH